MKKKNNIRKEELCQRSFRKRLCCMGVASALIISSIPNTFYEGLFSNSIIAYADNRDGFIPFTSDINDAYYDGQSDGYYSFRNLTEFAEYSRYCYQYSEAHQNDKIELAFGEVNPSETGSSYIALGKESCPFNGEIIVAEGSKNLLKLPEAMFEYVYDTVPIVSSRASNAAPTYVTIIRTEPNTNDPIFARHIKHNTNAPETVTINGETVPWTGINWQVRIDIYSSESGTENNDYAGIIGDIQKEAKVKLSVQDGTTGNISGNSDLGRICGKMGRDSMLTVDAIDGITTYSNDEPPVATTISNDSYTINTSSGNVGGIVGSMDDGSRLVMKCAPANNSADITTSSGYAGGIVGKNDGGSVDLSALSEYTVGGTIAGTLGVGGMFGYARPVFEGDPATAEFDVAKFDIDVTLSGNCNAGGLFGELENKTVSITEATENTSESRTFAAGGIIEIKDSTNDTTINVTHNGSGVNIGGIVGTYVPYSLDETLEISDIKVDVTKSGSFKNYGGGIGMIGYMSGTIQTASPAYVKFTNFEAEAAGFGSSTYFGGLVGKGDKAFIDADTITIDANSFHGGGAVGCLSSGVLKLSGKIDLSNAKPNHTSVDAVREGQIVGYRGDALIYYDGSNYASNLLLSDRRVDNVGSWGDILIVDGTKITKKGTSAASTDILEEKSNHTITLTAPTVSNNKASVSSAADFAKTSLAIQIDVSNNPILTRTDASFTGVSFGGSSVIDLTETGLRGLTRDNTDTKIGFSGAIEGNSKTVKLDIRNIGDKPVYRHQYNGLIGQATSVTVSSLTFDGIMKLEPEVVMYAGMAAACSKTGFTATTVNVASAAAFTTSSHSEGSDENKVYWGDAALYLGRLVGNVSGNIDVTGGTYSGSVTGDALSENSCYGGIVARIDGQTNSSFSGITISGTVSNTAAKKEQKVGGLVAVIEKADSVSKLTLGGTIAVSGLAVNGNASVSSGGLLGYTWYRTNVQGADTTTGVPPETSENGFTVSVTGNSSVEVSNGSTVNTGSTAGLVYCATGRWLVDTIGFDGFSANVNTSSSFGMLVNMGRYGSDGIYLLIPEENYTISADPMSSHSGVYDELVAYSSKDGIMNNGQGVVSVRTPSGNLLIMNGSGAGNTYTAKTTLGKNKTNENTRYYYNLDSIAIKSTAYGNYTDEQKAAVTDQVKLMNWGLYKYACANIQDYFCDPFGSNISGDFDMEGYSWYPITVDSSITVGGTLKLYNSELEKNIQKKTNTHYSTLTNTQHYLMHNALFYDVNAKLTVSSITLKGNVGKANFGSGTASGALVFGTVKGSSSSDSDTAEVKVTGSIILDGIHVHNFDPSVDANGNSNEYAPLLINRSGSFSKLTIKNVYVKDADSYLGSSSAATLKKKNNNIAASSPYTETSEPKAATSLIGRAGIDNTSNNVNVKFTAITLDGRKTGTCANDSELLTAYHTNESLFTKATLLDKFIYNSGGGTYEFEMNEDWNSGHKANVTYGSEISGSNGRTEYFGKEFWYKGLAPNGYYTNYQQPLTSGDGKVNGVFTAPVDFSGFLPYVYTKYNVNDKTHQLKVNQKTAEFSGCGTYNDPYIITDAGVLADLSNTINGEQTGLIEKINLPTKENEDNGSRIADLSATWDEDDQSGEKQHIEYEKQTDNSYKAGSDIVSLADLREYLAGAYYKIQDGAEIEIPSTSDFKGFGNVDSDAKFAAFRGVIYGTGNETITNKTAYPLIASSYGSVVRGITIKVDASFTKTNGAAANTFATDETGCPAYGAVFGKIFGGDNIIDNVYVEFEDTALITVSGDGKHVIPVGGYAGVIINGGLYFRNMDSGTRIGLPNANTSDGTGTLITGTDNEPNMKYLYVNPIIGRVMNGFAVTESDTFRPFDDGTRKYPDGSMVYQNSEGAYVTVAADDVASFDSSLAEGATMKNGTKNYAIADIDSDDTASFTMNGIENDSTITVKSAQGLFLMSLITQAGLGKSADGHYAQQTYLKPYDSNMATHVAEYSYVGNSALTGEEPVSANVNDTDALKDYFKSKNDKYSGSGSDKIPYLIHNYTEESSGTYPAFCVAGNADHYYNLSIALDDDTQETLYLPDGYRGLGMLMFGVSGIKNPGFTGEAETNLDNFKENVVFLKSFDGDEKHISMNMNLYVYDSDNYPTLQGSQAFFKNGFGLINCLQSSGDTTHKFKDLTIRGSVKYELISSSTGEHAAYNKNNIKNEKANPAVGALVGVPVAGSGAIYFDNIMLDSMSISGMCFAGGFVGAMNISATFYFTGCGADDLKVFAGGAAGGLIGYMRNQNAKVDADFGKTVNGETVNGEFGIISIISALESDSSGDINAAAGGLIGHRKSSKAANTENIMIKNVTIRNGDSVEEGGYIGYANDITDVTANPNSVRAGGIIGNAGQTTILNADHVTVKNLNICGAYSGGMIGYLLEANSRATFTNCSVLTDSTPKCRIESTKSDGSSGGYIGLNAAPNASTFDTCTLTNYTISGDASGGSCNVGGLVGYNSNDGKLVVKNSLLAGHCLKWGKYTGGLVGNLIKGELDGYNILMKDQNSLSSTASGSCNGYIVGTNAPKLIKIAGFSRQGTIDTAKMVGNSTSASAEKYGDGGYVVFADYNDKASADGANNQFSALKAAATTNVAEVPAGLSTMSDRYACVTKERTYKYVVHDGRIVGSPIDDSGWVEKEVSSYDKTISSEKEVTSSGIKVYSQDDDPQGVDDLSPIESLADLTGKKKDNGFYLYSKAAGKFITVAYDSSGNPTYNGSDNNHKALPVTDFNGTTDYGTPVLWYFEEVSSTDSKYRIYTKKGDVKFYIQSENDKTENVYLKPLINDYTKATVFIISDAYAENAAWNDKIENAGIDNAYKVKANDISLYSNSFYIKKANFTSPPFNETNSDNILESDDYRGSYLQYNPGRNSLRYYTNHFASKQYNSSNQYESNKNSRIQIFFAPETGVKKAQTLGSVTINGTMVSSSNSSVPVEADEAQISDFETNCPDDTYEFYYITEIMRQNIITDSLTSAPYVTTNPKRVVSADGKFLTGDGVYNTAQSSDYSFSGIAGIIADAQDSDNNKRYQHWQSDSYYPLTSANEGDTTMIDLLSTQKKYTTYKNARGSSTVSNSLNNLPVLVVDDINSVHTTQLINTYLGLLTNTNFNYADSSNTAFRLRIAVAEFKSNNLTVDYTAQPKLLIDSNRKRFKIGGSYDNSDMKKEQFTLIDVEYFDPSDTSNNRKVAYHLYVPVFVKKMLRFSFEAATISGTTYRIQPYKTALSQYGRVNIIENLGNPMTMQFTWTYEQSFDDWFELINSGENMLRSYEKKLEFSDETSLGLPTGTRMVLVDANRNNPAYYAEKSTTGLISHDDDLGIDCFDLGKFTSSDSDDPEAFTPIQFNDFFDIYDEAPTGTAGFRTTDEEFVTTDAAHATVKTNDGKYYKLYEEGDTGTRATLYVKYKQGMSNDNGYLTENYYLTFFTDAPSENDTSIYHLLFTGMQSFGGTEYPSSCSKRTGTDIFTGDIFENSCDIVALTPEPEMSAESNNTLTAQVTANVGIKAAAGGIIKSYVLMDSISVYQSFMLQLNKSYYTDDAMNNLTSEKGFAEGSSPHIEVSSYTVNGDDLATIKETDKYNRNANTLDGMSGDNALIDANYLEIQSNVNLKKYLYDNYSAYEENVSDKTTFPIVSEIRMTYADNISIAAQFPQNPSPETPKGSAIGTNIIGSSNVSSQAETAAYSKTSYPGSAPNKYYVTSVKKATLSYYSADTKEVEITPADDDNPAVTEERLLTENKYEQFGINAIDPVRDSETNSAVDMKTQADYNIVNLSEEAKETIRSMKVTITLRRKADYENTGKLPIEQFLVPDSLTLYNKTIGDDNKITKSNDSSLTDFVYYIDCTNEDFAGNIYTLPILFSAYTGENSDFENKDYSLEITDEETGETSTVTKNLFYSNYMVKVNVELYDGLGGSGNRITGSDANSHIIYTNAKIYYDVIPTS